MKILLLSSVGLISLISSGASAQGPATAPAQVDSGGLEDIVVTAQRRSERLQDVPVAVSAATAARLEAIGIQSSQELSVVTPGLTVPQTSGYTQPRIRGVGTTSNGPGIENPVATYIDGVYISSAPSSLLTLNNVERIEVLKGPQGTLFGRNATGGLIQIVTKDPKQTPGADVNFTYGNYETVIADAYLTSGLTDNLAADLAVRYEHQDEGFGRNLFNGRDVGKLDHDFAARTKFLLEASDDTQVRLALDYANRDSDQYIQHLTVGFPQTFNNPFFGGPFPLGGPYDVNADYEFRNKLKSGGGSLQIDHDFGNVSLKSISAYREAKFQFNLDLDYLPLNLVTAASSAEFSQISQELQLSSNATGPLTWVAGLYYFHSKEGWQPLAVGFGPAGSPIPGVPLSQIEDSTQKTDSVASYAQGTYELAPNTRLTLGGRFTYEKKTVSGTETVVAGGVPILTTPFPAPALGISNKIDFKRFNYRVALDHKFAEDVMGYVSFNTGFKSGGFVLGAATVAPYKPESIKAAEVGLKTQLFDRRLRLNVAGFYYDYKNIQVQRFDAGTIVIYNGAKAELYGIDLDGEVALAPGLTINGGLSYVHDRFKSFPNADYVVPVGNCVPAPGGVCSASAKGNRLPFTPTTTFNIGGNYEVETSAGTFALNATYFRSGKFFAAPDNVVSQKAYDLINASVSWTDPQDHVTIKLWGKNLGKTVYATSLLEGFSGPIRSLGLPRTYGVTAGFKF